ncbi:MAG: 7-carboxy-7-deazaguanine synthase QueE [Verrucomicrobiota bacterium]
MLISEIFYSIQGEGVLAGMPSVFVRTSGCNLRCAWCDTPYASWQPDGENMRVEEVVARVAGFNCRHVVLTGGEPLLARGIHELAFRLTELGMHVTIETAGTLAPDGICCDLASLSPKLANSTPSTAAAGAAWVARHEQARLQPAVLCEWLGTYPYQLKFVVSEAAQILEIQQLLETLECEVPAEKILLMPEGVSEEVVATRRDFVVAACKRYGYRYCQRLQIGLFGNARGT